MTSLSTTAIFTYAEIRWYLWTAYARIRSALRRRFSPDVAMKTSPMFSTRNHLASQRIFLRKMLREYPQWAQGHGRLGITELNLELLRDGPKDARALGAVRTSAEAVRELIVPENALHKGRALLEADYLDAMLRFLRKDYAGALIDLETLLQPEKSAHLTEDIYWSVLEHAAAAAMVVGDNDRAKAYFERIPVRARSGEQLTADKYLKLSPEAFVPTQDDCGARASRLAQKDN